MGFTKIALSSIAVGRRIVWYVVAYIGDGGWMSITEFWNNGKIFEKNNK